jgi:hypothetical protein
LNSGSRLQSRYSTTPLNHFALAILEMGSCKLFTPYGLKQGSSWSQPFQIGAEIIGVSYWLLALHAIYSFWTYYLNNSCVCCTIHYAGVVQKRNLEPVPSMLH